MTTKMDNLPSVKDINCPPEVKADSAWNSSELDADKTIKDAIKHENNTIFIKEEIDLDTNFNVDDSTDTPDNRFDTIEVPVDIIKEEPTETKPFVHERSLLNKHSSTLINSCMQGANIDAPSDVGMVSSTNWDSHSERGMSVEKFSNDGITAGECEIKIEMSEMENSSNIQVSIKSETIEQSVSDGIETPTHFLTGGCENKSNLRMESFSGSQPLVKNEQDVFPRSNDSVPMDHQKNDVRGIKEDITDLPDGLFIIETVPDNSHSERARREVWTTITLAEGTLFGPFPEDTVALDRNELVTTDKDDSQGDIKTDLKLKTPHQWTSFIKGTKNRRFCNTELVSHNGLLHYRIKRKIKPGTPLMIFNQRPYKCDKCSKAFTQSGSLKIHMMSHDEQKHVFHCSLCGKEFKTISMLRYHKQAHQGKRFHCSECGKEFLTAGNLKVHSVTHTGEKPFSCPVCNKRFATASNLKAHQISVHTGARPFKCSVCSKAFSYPVDLKRHIVTHSDDKTHICKVCGNGFKLANQLRLHELIHSDNRPYRCADCGASFKTSGNLRSHKLTHQDHKPHTCSVCHKCFARPTQLKIHMVNHTGNYQYKCDICGKSFADESYLKYHKLKHDERKEHPCDVCGKTFGLRSRLNHHKKLHSPNKPMNQCPICSKQFTTAAYRDIHLTLHADKKAHICPICSKEFTQKKHLQDHMVHHTGQYEYKCEECGKEFVREQELKIHQLVHSTEQPFKCKVCGKGFALSSRLKYHQLTHEEKTQKCTICNKTFARKSHLKSHMQTHVKKESVDQRNQESSKVKEKNRPHKCDMCSKGFAYSANLAKHKLTHKN